ncbi:hypothetical protein [Paenibacillus harenae]|uniref:hypothetical protein n=1 Tax=Paenibacillus harenae TaxID=306543 RepID=UPI002794B277|nr:hypothetical protein [Paenibacillus harenae]
MGTSERIHYRADLRRDLAASLGGRRAAWPMKLDEDETAYLEEPYLPHPVIGH